MNAGVPEGSILGPTLFILYINDIHNASRSGSNILFADDILNYDQDECYFRLIERVNSNLQNLRRWFIANSLSINNLKTEVMLFTRKTVYFPLPPVLFNNQAITFSYSVKFLGIHLDPKLSWKNHILHVKNKISSACGVLHTLRGKISVNIAKMIYFSVAYPHFMYGNIVWSSSARTNLNPLILIQKRMIRIIAR